MMKRLITTLLFISSVYAEQDQGSASNRYLKEIIDENPSLSRAMEIDEVNTIYKSCFDHYHNGGNGSISGNKLMGCLWEGDTAAGISGVSQNEDLAKQVTAVMETDAKGKEVNSIRYQQSVKVQKKVSPGLKALQDYYEKQLNEALYGKATNNKNKLIKTEKTVDQKVFFELHKSQLGKNIIAALSSYCIEAENLQGEFPIINKENKDQIRKSNLKNLNELTASGETLSASANWNVCIQNIQYICHQPTSLKTRDEAGQEVGSSNQFSKDKLIDTCETELPKKYQKDCTDIIEYSQTRACVVTQYIDEARRNLQVVDSTIEGYDKLKATNRNPANISFYSTSQKEKTIDDLTSITSKEVLDSGLAKGNQEQLAQIEECIKTKDKELCSQFLDSNKEESYAVLAEFKLKQEAALAKLEGIEKDDVETIKELLLEEGYTEEDAQEMASVEDIKQQIEEKYKAKKDALLRNMADELDKHTIAGKEMDLSNDSTDLKMLKKIEAELKGKTQEFAELVHFNNIVSGYLDTTTGEGDDAQKSSNTASLQRELDSNLFTDANLKEAKEFELKNNQQTDYDSYVSNTLSKTGVNLDPGSTTDADTTAIDIKDINTHILNYFKTKKDSP